MGSLIKKAIWKSSSTNSRIAELVGCCFVLLQTKINVALIKDGWLGYVSVCIYNLVSVCCVHVDVQ